MPRTKASPKPKPSTSPSSDPSPTEAPLRLHVFDVGHGDSLLIEFPNGRDFGIIDCHRKSVKDRPKVASYLLDAHRTRGPIVVKFAALTHPDTDHLRGYGETLETLIAEGIEVEEFWNSPMTRAWWGAYRQNLLGYGDERDFGELDRLVRAVVKLTDGYQNHRYREIRSTNPVEAWRWPSVESPQVSIEFLAPNHKFIVAHTMSRLETIAADRKRLARKTGPGCDINLISSAFRVRYGAATLLLGGDMMNPAWEVLLTTEGRHDPRSLVLKVPHHGSVHSNFPHEKPLCDVVKIKGSRLYPVISGGYLPDLPHEKTLTSLRKHRGKIYVTGGGAEERAEPHHPAIEAEAGLGFPGDVGARELIYREGRGAGDIVVDCFSNGDVPRQAGAQSLTAPNRNPVRSIRRDCRSRPTLVKRLDQVPADRRPKVVHSFRGPSGLGGQGRCAESLRQCLDHRLRTVGPGPACQPRAIEQSNDRLDPQDLRRHRKASLASLQGPDHRQGCHRFGCLGIVDSEPSGHEIVRDQAPLPGNQAGRIESLKRIGCQQLDRMGEAGDGRARLGEQEQVRRRQQ